MKSQHKILKFPVKAKGRQTKQVRNLDQVKYFFEQQIRALRKIARDRAATGLLSAVKGWAIIDTLTSSGLRVSELCDLRVSDLNIDYGQSKIFVRNGKCHLSGSVVIPEGLKKHLKSFLKWKSGLGEPVGQDDYLLIDQRGPMSSQGVQQIVKKYLKQLGFYESGKSVHALRHSYAVAFYAREKDLKALQRQLRHSNPQSTSIYANVSDEDIAGQVKGLWG